MATEQPPCAWEADYCDAGEPEWSDEDKAKFEQVATEYLWNWTGRTFGVCSVTVRPCRRPCPTGNAYVGRGRIWDPVLVRGRWLNVSCGYCRSDNCGCTYADTLRLPGPVADVTEILIDGVTLPASAYRVDNHRLLVRTDGNEWPTCQDLLLPDTEPGTWSITYDYGTEVPAGGQIAAGTLAAEFYKAACNDASCALPKRVQTVTRQGVTVAMLDAFDDIDTGHTGIWVIDAWVTSVMKRPIPASVHSPDYRPGGRFRTTTYGG